MQALLRRGTSLFSGRSGRKANTASSEDKLFPKVDPAVDGEDCDHDCSSCTIHYPKKFDIDLEDKLYGHVKGWATHVLVATGKTDWVRDVADEEGSVMEAIEKGDLKPSNGNMKLSASNIPVPDEYHHYEPGKQPTTVLILPEFTIVEHVTPQLAPDLVKYFVEPAITTTTPLISGQGGGTPRSSSATPSRSATPAQPSTPTTTMPETPIDLTSLTPLRARPCPHAAVILLCSQRTRDARCGQSAPLLRREFERHLRARGLYRDMHDERPGGVGIYFISHVGGHKYAANVMVYRRRDFEWFRKEQAADASKGDGYAVEQGKKAEGDEEGNVDEGAAQGIWLARVRPEDCEGIVKFTVLQGKVVKPATQLRGGFDREKGLVSW